MKTIRIAFTDMYDGFDPSNNDFIQVLRTRYQVILDDKNPEYLFYSCFGMNHCRYNHCVKIEFLGEVISPDFNFCDYAIGFDKISFGDRYFRFPLYYMYCRQCVNSGKLSPEDAEKVFQRNKFCSFLYSNANYCDEMRKKLLDELSTVGQVDSGGKYLNNTGYRVPDKIKWLQEYQFNIACENTSHPGYTTEKMIEPLIAGNIPIYWGDPNVFSDFNKKRIIAVSDYPNLHALAADIKALSMDKTRFCAMLEEPWFASSDKEPEIMWKRFEEFIFSIFDCPVSSAYRRSMYGYTKTYVPVRINLARVYFLMHKITRLVTKLKNKMKR